MAITTIIDKTMAVAMAEMRWRFRGRVFVTSRRRIVLLIFFVTLGFIHNQVNNLTEELAENEITSETVTMRETSWTRVQLPMTKTIHQSHSDSLATVTLVIVLCDKPPEKRGGGPTVANTASNSYTEPKMGLTRLLRQLRVMLKSLVLSEHTFVHSHSHPHRSTPVAGTPPPPTLHLLVFTDNEATFTEINHFLYFSGEIHSDYAGLLRLTYVPLVYPPQYEHMKYFFRPCGTFRLFLSEIPELYSPLVDSDSLLYVDTDIIFIRHVRHIFAAAEQAGLGDMGDLGGGDERHIGRLPWAAMAPDWYHEHWPPTAVPFPGLQGVNSGVALFNLTRMRASELLTSLPSIMSGAYGKRVGEDQDVFNIYFHDHPEQLVLLPCSSNFIYHLCLPNPSCNCSTTPQDPGIVAIHGCAQSFFPPEVYKSVSQFALIFEAYERLSLASVVDVHGFQRKLARKLYTRQQRHARDPEERSNYKDPFVGACARNQGFVHKLFGGA